MIKIYIKIKKVERSIKFVNNYDCFINLSFKREIIYVFVIKFIKNYYKKI